MYFEAIAPCFPHSPCCSFCHKPPSPWTDMRNFSQFLHQVTTHFSLGHLKAAGNHVSSAYHLSPSNGCVHFPSHRCQVYSNLFSLDWREHKDDQIVPISPGVPQHHILGGRGPAIGTVAKFKEGQGLQCHFVGGEWGSKAVNLPSPMHFLIGTLCVCTLEPCISDADLLFLA